MRALLAWLRWFRAPEPAPVPEPPPRVWRGLHLTGEQRDQARAVRRARLLERQDPAHPEHVGRRP